MIVIRPNLWENILSASSVFKNIPSWLNDEVPNWESDDAFQTADLGVFIYKAMYSEFDERSLKGVVIL